MTITSIAPLAPFCRGLCRRRAKRPAYKHLHTASYLAGASRAIRVRTTGRWCTAGLWSFAPRSRHVTPARRLSRAVRDPREEHVGVGVNVASLTPPEF